MMHYDDDGDDDDNGDDIDDRDSCDWTQLTSVMITT